MEKPTAIKDKNAIAYIEFLETKLKSPYYNSFLALKTTIDNYNAQLIANKVDLFDVDDKAKFEMSHKYLTEQKPYLEQMEYLLNKMSPEEKETANEKLLDAANPAELLALKHKKNGTNR
jgi:hypothetical protein